MCGIVAYSGKREVYPLLIKGLKRLEYRGYDSAGIAIVNSEIKVFKKKGKVSELELLLENEKITGNIGMGHTRWATHGEPSDRNAHPHFSSNRKLAVIHNGIIENYGVIKKDLLKKGHKFESDTDTEVLVHFIEDIYENEKCELHEAVRLALNKIVGAYAIVVLSEDSPNMLVAARKGSPLVIGVGEDELFLASDATPIIEYTQNVIYLKDQEIVIFDGTDYKVINTQDVQITPYIEKLDMELESIEKGGFEHFMLKEIFEQPKSVLDCMRGRLNSESGYLMLGGIREYAKKLEKAERLIIVACGTSWHAGLVAEYFFEELCRIPVEVEYASEFRYRNPVIKEGDIVFAISQSGETADTIAAIEMAKSKGAIIFGVCNVVGSSISRITHEGAYTHAGPEIGVASTKAFTAQLIVLFMIGLRMAHQKGTIKEKDYRNLLTEMENLPAKIEKALSINEQIKKISEIFSGSRNFLYLGRGYNFPVALEGALKLKEISYIHAEGYPAAEMKHGPIALIDEEMPVVFIATQDSSYEKIISNIQEVLARKGRVIAIVTEGDSIVKDLAEFVIEVPKAHEAITPILSVIPLQLLAYHIAVLRGCNVDQPRNLAKSVTVE